MTSARLYKDILLKFTPNRPAPARPPRLADPIEVHVKYVFNKFYSIPYAAQRLPRNFANPSTELPIARPIHGIEHATRVAINVRAFANLFRRQGHEEALSLTDEDIKLLQIAALFHDAARKNDGEDYWDENSAWMLYQYLTKTLHVAHDKAKMLAEAIANKDAKPGKHKELVINAAGQPTWVASPHIQDKNLYQMLIHDGDCLDVIRATEAFDGRTHLDFYKECAAHHPGALNELAKLITEARSLIARQGDAYNQLNFTVKKKYECENAYENIMADITNHQFDYVAYRALSGNNSLMVGNALEQSFLPDYAARDSDRITAQSLTAAMHQGHLALRGVYAPGATSVYREKDLKSSAEVDIEKLLRLPVVPTNSKDPSQRLGKKGNPDRSVTCALPGSRLYVNQGLVVKGFDREDVSNIYYADADTDRGKKRHQKKLKPEEIVTRHQELIKLEKMGGSITWKRRRMVASHNEMIMRITRVDAIYYSFDAMKFNLNIHGNAKPINAYAPILQAIDIQIKYQKKRGVTLPIFEYSSEHAYIKAAPDFTDDKIIELWVAMISDLINEKLRTEHRLDQSIEDLKLAGIYGVIPISAGSLIREKHSLDLMYSAELRERLNSALEVARVKCLSEHAANHRESKNEDLAESREVKKVKTDSEQKLCVDTYVANNTSAMFQGPLSGKKRANDTLGNHFSKSPRMCLVR